MKENKVKILPLGSRSPEPTIDDLDIDADDIRVTNDIDIFGAPSKNNKTRIVST